MERWLAACLVWGLSGCEANPRGEQEVLSTKHALVYGADDRMAMTDAFFANNPTWRAMGRLSTSIGTCTATHIGQNYLLTARHCVADLEVPGNIVFRPAFTGLDARADERPSIRGKRVVRGTGSFGKFSSGGAYYPGGDWAFIELDPATYQRGTGGVGVPTFPSSWAGWASIPLGALPNPLPQTVASAAGYSGDFFYGRQMQADGGGYQPPFTAGQLAAGLHQGCTLYKDALASSAWCGEGEGIVLTDCEFNGGASGGPVVVGGLTNPVIVAVNGGGGGDELATPPPAYTEGIANRVVNVNAFNTAPRDVGGFTLTPMGNGVTLGVLSDASGPGQLRWNNFDTPPEGIRPRHAWRPWGDPASQSTRFGRMSSTFTTDGHAFLLAVGDGQLWNRWETGVGAWSSWGVFFPGSSMSTAPLDVEAASTGNVAAQVYTLHAAGQVRTRRKLGAWNAAWENELDLGTVSGASALAVGTTGGYQQLFVATPSGVMTRWETAPGSNTWWGWTDFSAGLPGGVTWLDVAAGLDGSGRMDVVLLGRDAAGGRVLYRRTKTSSQPGAAWGPWDLPSWAPPGATQVELAPTSSAPGAFGVGERLFVISDGELLVADPAVMDIEAPTLQPSHFWVPAQMPEPIPSHPACP